MLAVSADNPLREPARERDRYRSAPVGQEPVTRRIIDELNLTAFCGIVQVESAANSLRYFGCSHSGKLRVFYNPLNVSRPLVVFSI